MFVAHAVPRGDDMEILADGRSSILFATLAGVSLGLMTGADRPLPSGRRGDRMTSIVLRALILFLVGILLTTTGSEIAIILDYYAVMFLLLLPVLFAPRRVLAPTAAVLVVGAPLLASAVDGRAPAADLLYLAQTYLLTGYYPALVWLPFLIAGLICARSGLERARTQVWMIGGGVLGAVAGYGAAALLPGVSAEAHSGSTAEVVGSGGVAVAVIGVLLWLTSAERETIGRVVRTVLWPIAATGAMALTVYTLQIVTLAIFARLRDESGGAIEYPGWPLLIGMSVASIAFASAWRALFGSGPFERLMTIMTRTPKRPASGTDGPQPSENSRGTEPDRERLDPPRR